MKSLHKTSLVFLCLFLVTGLFTRHRLHSLIVGSQSESTQSDVSSLQANENSLSNFVPSVTNVVPLSDSSERAANKDIMVNGLAAIERPSWKFHDGFISHYAQLQRQASQGNNQARYIFALNLKYCFNVPLSQDSLDDKIQEISSYSDAANTVDRLIERYDYCSGLTQENLHSYYQYLHDAAESGFVRAQEEVSRITTAMFMQLENYDELPRDACISKRDDFNRSKLSFLEKAGKRGSISALKRLSRMHYSQNFGVNGRMKAYALNKVILALTDDHDTYNRYSWFVQRQYDELSAEELEKAQSMSQAWIKQVYENGTIYRE